MRSGRVQSTGPWVPMEPVQHPPQHVGTVTNPEASLYLCLLINCFGLLFWLFWVFVASHGLLFLVVPRSLAVVASLVWTEHTGARCADSVVVGVGLAAPWPVDLPSPGFEPMSPALAGRLLSTVAPGSPVLCLALESACTCVNCTSRRMVKRLYFIEGRHQF